MRVTLVVPVINELEGLKTYMPRIHNDWVSQVIILDGKSHDGTDEWAKQQGYEVFTQTQNGLWNAYTELFKSGMVKGDVIITFSPDGNCIPEDIPKMLEMMNQGYDMVIASRYTGGARSEDDTVLTGFGNHVLTGLCNLRSYYKYRDALTMYRAFHYKLVKYLGLCESPNWLQRKLIKTSNLYSWEPSMAIRAGRFRYPNKVSGLRIAEIPSNEPKALRARREGIFTHGGMILMQILHESLR